MATHEQLEDFEVWDPESGQSTTLAAGDETAARTSAWRAWHDGASPTTPEAEYAFGQLVVTRCDEMSQADDETDAEAGAGQ